MYRTITYWPNGNWCESFDTEEYMADLGLSDDYATIRIEEEATDEEVEKQVQVLNRGESK